MVRVKNMWDANSLLHFAAHLQLAFHTLDVKSRMLHLGCSCQHLGCLHFPAIHYNVALNNLFLLLSSLHAKPTSMKEKSVLNQFIPT